MINETAYQLGTKRSCIRELFEYGNRRKAEGAKVLDYSLGNPSMPAPPAVTQTIQTLLQNTDSVTLHGYTSAVGALSARQAIADDLTRRYGVCVSPEELFLTCGAAPALCAVFRALSVPQGELLAIAPYFPEYVPFSQEAGLAFRAVPADLPDFQIQLDALEERLTPHTQAVLLNSPNNPSGVVYTRQTLEKLASLLQEKAAAFGHPIYIVSDEPYRELCYNGQVPLLPEIYKDTIVCYSYSKSLSLPGERIGYVYVPATATDGKAVYAAVAGAARSLGHVCAPSLWQQVIAQCAHVRPDLDSYRKNRDALYTALVEMGYTVAKPDGAFYLFVKAPGDDANAFSEKAKEYDLLVVPGDDFGCPGYFRLCYCVPYEQICDSLPVFEKLLEE